jgi:hypothetical protein
MLFDLNQMKGGMVEFQAQNGVDRHLERFSGHKSSGMPVSA